VEPSKIPPLCPAICTFYLIMAKAYVPLNVDKPPAMGQDIEDMPGLFAQPYKVSAISERMEERLKLNAKVATHAAVRNTKQSRVEQRRWKRESEFSRDKEMTHGALKENDFDNVKETTLTEHAALVESSRCLKCADAPCTKSCPTSIDIKTFIQCISTKDYYGAAKTILSDNPIGLTCGSVCPASELCVGSCNLAGHAKPVNINGLQEFAVAEFMKWGIKQVCNTDISANPEPYMQKIGIIGAGPAGLACANYLGRLGYKSVTIFEKTDHPGGLSAHEIPQFRCHWDGVRFEARLCEDLGVNFKYGTALGSPALPNLTALHEQGYKAVFASIGMDEPNKAACFQGLGPEQGVWTSKEFLPRVSGGSKALSGKRTTLPKLSGQVLILGAGDTAFDCVGSAFRVGAKRVTCVSRKSWSDMRAVCEERELEIREFADFVTLCEPIGVQVDSNGHICAVEFRHYHSEDNEHPEMGNTNYTVAKQGDKEQTITMRCSGVVLAFGCYLSKQITAGLAPLEFENRLVKVNDVQQSLTHPWAFAGGDIAGATMTVEAANDGKMAAWGIHSYLQPGIASPERPMLPLFETEIDKVDISIVMAGVKFPNPFGLASAPCCTSAHMIRRAFEAGWGFAVTKTFVLDKDVPVNVSPRIVRTTNSPQLYGPHQNGFVNVELVTEKTAAYWCKTMVELKVDFPDNPIIASIMSANVKEDWVLLTKMCVKAGAAMIELNMSCPHGMHEVGMGLECGQSPEAIENISRWCNEVAEGLPVFVKMTPNISDMTLCALAAKRGGCAGVTVMNTILGIMDFDPVGDPWPKIGSAKYIAAGGMCGDQNRPICSRMVAEVRKACGPEFFIMGTGGVSSADSTMQLLRLGASTMQICSAIQNQDFSIVYDYSLGLKTMLYRMGRGDYDSANGFQNSWSATQAYGKDVEGAHDADPHYGDFQRKRRKNRRDELLRVEDISDACCCKQDDISCHKKEGSVVPAKLIDLVGDRNERVKQHSDLSRKEQVVAVVIEELCIQCGKCYMTCNDNAYQAIIFTPEHKAKVVTEDCTGCGLCQAVCPVPGCIQYQPMKGTFHPHRGIKPMKDRWELDGKFL